MVCEIISNCTVLLRRANSVQWVPDHVGGNEAADREATVALYSWVDIRYTTSEIGDLVTFGIKVVEPIEYFHLWTFLLRY